jgi:polysaccharide deacetylase 2 family uncharacterized protein YibQ
MASGFFGGIIVGTVVSGLGIAAVSLLAGLPGTLPPEATALDIPAGSEFNQPRVDVWAELPGAETSPDAGESSQVDAPAPDDLNAVNSEATEPAAQPDAGNSASGLILPVGLDENTGVGAVSATDRPVLHRPVVAVPAAPETESALFIVTEPAALPALNNPRYADTDNPVQSVDMQASTAAILAELLDLPQGPSAGNWEQLLSQESAALDIPKIIPVQPMLQQASVTDQTLSLDQNVATDAQSQAAASVTPSGPIVVLGHDLAPDAVITDASAADRQDAPLVVAQEGGADAQDDALPKSGGFENLAPDVTTNRLPSVTNTPAVVEDTPKADTAEEVEAEDLPQLERFAAEFENPDAKPLMAIVLIDDGTSQIDLEKLKSFPYPLSFAIDTKWPGAAKAMRAYRDAGFEVLAMADLPKGAGAADTEVTMAIYLRAVPEAVAVMEGEGEGLQSGRKASAQLAQILAASGLGAVMLPKGLNTAQKLIAREGVPAITVFRDFDAKGESAQTIQRYLDRAVLKAGQEENGVIMVGRLRDVTINALVVWALEDRAARVAMAPVSAVLRGM